MLSLLRVAANARRRPEMPPKHAIFAAGSVGCEFEEVKLVQDRANGRTVLRFVRAVRSKGVPASVTWRCSTVHGARPIPRIFH
jgi:hypothetical protein